MRRVFGETGFPIYSPLGSAGTQDAGLLGLRLVGKLLRGPNGPGALPRPPLDPACEADDNGCKNSNPERSIFSDTRHHSQALVPYLVYNDLREAGDRFFLLYT